MQGIIQTFVEINLSSKTVDLALSKKKPFNVLASFSFGIGNVSSSVSFLFSLIKFLNTFYEEYSKMVFIFSLYIYGF